MDDGGHKAQDTTGSLETVQLGPVVVQSVEQLGMDGISGFQAALVASLPAVRWKLLRLGAVQVGEGPGNRIEGGEVPLLRDGLEESPAHDLEAFLGTGRSPHRLQAAERIAQALDSFAAAFATDLNVGGRDASHQEGLRGCLGRFSERPSKEPAGRPETP